MKKIDLPHLPPLRFAKEILKSTSKEAEVSIEFADIPTLPMLVEAAAQSCAAFREYEDGDAFLVSLKGIQLLQTPTKTDFIAHVTQEHKLDAMRYVAFDIKEDATPIATGNLVLAVE